MIKRSPPFAPRHHPPGAASRRARAFTLLEVLMVVTLLAIILGLIVGGAFAAMRWSRAQQTTAALSALDAVAETYRRETQEWLPVFPNANTQSQMAYFIRATYGDRTDGSEAIGDIDKQLHDLGAAFVQPGPAPTGPTPPAAPNGGVLDPYGNIINCYNPFKGFWSNGTTYYVGDCVIFPVPPATPGVRYRCIDISTNNQPDTSSAYWVADATAGRPWFWSNGPDGINDSPPNGRNNSVTGSVSGDDVASTGSKP